ADTSAKYGPLSAKQLDETLYDLKFKKKSSPMAQLADLYLYPIARGGYAPSYRPYVMLKDKQKLINDCLGEDDVAHIGIKYSCFDLIEKEQSKNKKNRK